MYNQVCVKKAGDKTSLIPTPDSHKQPTMMKAVTTVAM